MKNADQIASELLQGQVGGPFEGVGGYGRGGVGDAVTVVPQYPGRAGSPGVAPYYVGVPAVAAGADPGGMAVQYSPQQYVAGDVTYLGFGSTSIPAGSPGTAVPVSTNRPFTPQKMGCPSTVLGLLITQVNISGTNLLANSLGLPVELQSVVSTFPPAYPAIVPTARPTGATITATRNTM